LFVIRFFSVTPESDRGQELKASATDNPNTRLNVSDDSIVTSSDGVLRFLYDSVKNNMSYNYLVLDSFDAIQQNEEYYASLFPSVKGFVFSEPNIYVNCVAVRCDYIYNELSFTAEERAVDYAIANDTTALLTDSERELYDEVLRVTELCDISSEYYLVKNIHDYLVLNIEYGYPIRDDGYQYPNDAQLLRSALFKNKCVCAGYAKAFYFLCRACGLDVVYVTGTAINSSGQSESHAWNKVKVDGKWYNVDCTWDDPIVSLSGSQSEGGSDNIDYFYFLIPDEILAVNHTWDDDPYPDAVSSDLNDIYEQFEGVEKFTSATAAYGYILSELERYEASHSVSQPGFDFGLTLTCTDYSLADSIAALCGEYHDTYRCGYEFHGEGAGVYGNMFALRIFNGPADNG